MLRRSARLSPLLTLEFSIRDMQRRKWRLRLAEIIAAALTNQARIFPVR